MKWQVTEELAGRVDAYCRAYLAAPWWLLLIDGLIPIGLWEIVWWIIRHVRLEVV